MTPRGAIALAAALRGGTVTSTAATRACLEIIAAKEPEIGAWAWLDAESALRQAEEADRALAAGTVPGPLHGMPVAVKDIIDTADMPTENGTVLHAERRPARDAYMVARLRELGAVIVGKTVTTEFAVAAAGKTRNPRDLARTPGGSSSGSGAAVAAGMVPLALGTQTGGSVIRPAAYCGVVGYKPSFGTIPRTGILTTAPSFDQPGVFARSVADAAWFAQRFVGRDAGDFAAQPPAGLSLFPFAARSSPPRFAFLRTPAWPQMEPAAARSFETFIAAMPGRVEEIALPPDFARAQAAFWAACGREMARALANDSARGEERMSAQLRGTLAAGRQVSDADYRAALSLIPILRGLLAKTLRGFDAALTPAVPAPAPLFATGTGNSVCCLLWSFLGAPALNLPLVEAEGLPLGVQVVGPHGDDARVLGAADWLERNAPAP